MRRARLFLLVLAAATASPYTASAQRHPELAELYLQGEYAAAAEQARAGLATAPDDLELHLVLGRALADLERFEEAEAPLERVLELDPERSWPTAWALAYLGRVRYAQGDTAAARAALERAIRLDVTRNATRSAHMWSRLLGFAPLYDTWADTTSEHFRFRFAPSLPQERFGAFVQAHEQAYERIADFFGTAPERRIQYFVWGEEETEQADWRPGFARPAFAIVHARPNQTTGHEMTQVISYAVVEPEHRTGLINEGTAVYLDQSGRDPLAEARQAMIRHGADTVSVEALWSRWGSLPNEAAYPLAGAFVGHLIEYGGKERFLELLRDQRLEHARALYGPELQELIVGFEAVLRR